MRLGLVHGSSVVTTTYFLVIFLILLLCSLVLLTLFLEERTAMWCAHMTPEGLGLAESRVVCSLTCGERSALLSWSGGRGEPPCCGRGCGRPREGACAVVSGGLITHADWSG